MLKRQYKDGMSHGFILESTIGKCIHGKFISKHISKDRIEDPFGEISELPRVTYNIVKFKIKKEGLGLTIIDSPRSTRNFINALYEIMGLEFLISEISIDPIEWLKQIEEQTGKVNAIKIGAIDINIQDRALARIEVTGVEDIRKEFNKFIQEKYHKINFVKYITNISGCGNIILRRNGSIKIEGSILNETIDAISNSLEIINN